MSDEPKIDPTDSTYWAINKVLDELLGTEEQDGAGQGLVADLYLLAQQRDEARAELARLAAPTSPSEPAVKIVPDSEFLRLQQYQRASPPPPLNTTMPEAAFSVSVEPVPSTPRVFAMPEIPEDVRRLRDRDGNVWYRDPAGKWEQRRHPVGLTDWGICDLLTSFGPLTEVEETNDAD